MSLSGTYLDILRGLVLLALLAGFLAIWIWAWGGKRESGFRKASLMPLEDDEVALPASDGVKNARE